VGQGEKTKVRWYPLNIFNIVGTIVAYLRWVTGHLGDLLPKAPFIFIFVQY